MIRQETLIRNSKTVDEGTMGFHDYVDKKESMEAFIQRVTDKMNDINGYADVFNVSYPNEDTAIITYMSVGSLTKDPCHMCNNSKIDEELNDNNDYSACTIGIWNDDNLRMMLCSGGRKPTRIELEKWIDKIGWVTIGVYYPKYCPNCGREIIEYNKEA